MADATLTEVIESVKGLTPEQQGHVRELLDSLLDGERDAGKAQALHEALRAAGLVKEPRKPSISIDGGRRRIQVHGPALSQTIIEERR